MNDIKLTLTSYAALFLGVYFTDLSEDPAKWFLVI